MNLYQITFDTTTITVLARNYQELLKILQEEDDSFVSIMGDNLQYEWDEDTVDSCHIHIVDITNPHIVQWEQH